jgi:hypothetical protein
LIVPPTGRWLCAGVESKRAREDSNFKPSDP